MKLFLYLNRIHIRSRIGGAIGIIAMCCAFLYWALAGREEILVIDHPLPLDPSTPEDLWYMADGTLAAVGHERYEVWLKQWAPGSALPSVVRFDLASKFHVQPRYSLRVASGAPGQWVPYAVSNDGKQIAWAWGGVLHIRATDAVRAPEHTLTLPQKLPIEAVVFLKKTTVGVLDITGSFEELEVRGPEAKKVVSIPFAGKVTIWTRGPRLLISLFDTGDIYTADFSGRMAYNPVPGIYQNGNSLAVSPHGRIAVGTNDRTVVYTIPSKNASDSIDSQDVDVGAVTALGFYNDRELVVGGTGSGLYLMKTVPEKPEPINLGKSNNVRLLAIKGQQIAYASANSVKIGTLIKKTVTTENSSKAWSWTMAIISILGFTMAMLRDVRSN
jgi:hypothetical protein